MPGKFCTHGSSSSISSSLSLHTAQGPEDVQTVPENTLFDDDGDPADVVLALDEAAGQTGDVHSPMVGNMMVLEWATGDHNMVATVTDGIMVVDSRSIGSGMTMMEDCKTPRFVAAHLLTCPTELAQLYCQGERIHGLKNKLRDQEKSNSALSDGNMKTAIVQL
ncbi:hypothetical protein M404DRAFT_32874 [Pisolithus tinctorius Marx 270]|uniref:Uncharacterized protein n=1 Tax=Pisolithus tinctorius Marx 270 TaxID=870435 RepID=A0A0C3JGX8_PISTI|nr:hypothetical protein M404DRAFT_32874 [Pisolithus tinctorius Marx 270]